MPRVGFPTEAADTSADVTKGRDLSAAKVRREVRQHAFIFCLSIGRKCNKRFQHSLLRTARSHVIECSFSFRKQLMCSAGQQMTRHQHPLVEWRAV